MSHVISGLAGTGLVEILPWLMIYRNVNLHEGGSLEYSNVHLVHLFKTLFIVLCGFINRTPADISEQMESSSCSPENAWGRDILK